MRDRRSSFSRSACLAAGMMLGGFFVVGLTACGETASVPVRLAFEVRSAHLDDCASGRGVLRFYVSELAMIDEEGGRVPVRLDADSRWQSLGTALVALGGECPGSAATPSNGTVIGSVEPGQYEAVEFQLGVPFAGNHGNPLRAEPPLDVPSMFWTWQSGHKFLRLDLGDRWSFHLGSTGCMSASAVRAPSGQCRAPECRAGAPSGQSRRRGQGHRRYRRPAGGGRHRPRAQLRGPIRGPGILSAVVGGPGHRRRDRPLRGRLRRAEGVQAR